MFHTMQRIFPRSKAFLTANRRLSPAISQGSRLEHTLNIEPSKRGLPLQEVAADQHRTKFFETPEHNLKIPHQTEQTNIPHHLKVAALDTSYCPLSKLDLPVPYTYELHVYETTHTSQIVSRIRDADIIICSRVALSSTLLSKQICPNLKMISVVASGTDLISKAVCRERGIHVANSPDCNSLAVAEHALGLYFSVRRAIPLSNEMVRRGYWVDDGNVNRLVERLRRTCWVPPVTCDREVMGIVGYGGIGRALPRRAQALDMKVLIAGRKGAPAGPGRTPFESVIRNSSIIVLAVHLLSETMGLIGQAEFELMQRSCILVNVSRGGVVEENALVKALRQNTIVGAGTDVCLREPATPENSILLGNETKDLNLVVTPHIAWFAKGTQDNFNRCLRENISSWLRGEARNSVT